MALAKNNANSGAGVLPQFDEQFLIRGVGLIQSLDDIRSIVLKERNGVPVYMKDVAEVKLGHEVRVGSLVKNGDTESVGAIVMMIRGGNAKEVVTRIKTKVDEINKKQLLLAVFKSNHSMIEVSLWILHYLLWLKYSSRV